MPARSVNGTSIFYEESGRGGGGDSAAPPVVLLHGFPLDSRIWAAQRRALPEKFRVITPDLRGFGQSAASTAPFSLELLADDVHALLKELGAERCALGGLSMGGYVALAYVKKYGGELRGLMLIDTKAEADTPEGKEARTRMVEVARQKGSSAIADLMEPKMLAPDAAKQRPAVAKELRAIMEACPPLTIEHALLAMRERPDRVAELGQIKVPTLIVVGEHDAITPPAVAETMRKGIPNARLVVVRGAGHMSCMEQPEQVNQAMREFVAGIV